MTQATLPPPTLAARYEAEFPNSAKLFDQAKTLFPNGVTHDSALPGTVSRSTSSGPKERTSGTSTVTG